jgi:hypothetical protein
MSRLLTPTDLVTLRHKPRALALLHDEALLVQRHRPLLFSVRSLLTNSGRYTTFVHHEQGVTAVLQAVRRESRPEQTVVALASYGELYQLPTDHDLWFRLLEAHVTHSARHQIQMTSGRSFGRVGLPRMSAKSYSGSMVLIGIRERVLHPCKRKVGMTYGVCISSMVTSPHAPFS